MLIKGLHHACIKCKESDFDKVKAFYGDILEMPEVRHWGEGKSAGIMYDTGCGIIEIFASEDFDLPQGAVRHFALATDDVDKCVDALKKEGYEITIEPKDVTLPSADPLNVRIAFAIGPVGEEIEFFCEK